MSDLSDHMNSFNTRILPLMINVLSFVLQVSSVASTATSTPASVMPSYYEFLDSTGEVIVRGTRWIRLFPTDGSISWGPGAIVRCVATLGKCTLTQFYDGGATRENTTYKITRWDSGRIEAEGEGTDMPRPSLSQGYLKQLGTTCLILNRDKRQAFMAHRKETKTCRNLDMDLGGSVVIDADQLCHLKRGETNAYDCPKPPRPTDKHGKSAPTPTYHLSNGVPYCENWVLNRAGEWEDHVRACPIEK
jgi:hypothetical protein